MKQYSVMVVLACVVCAAWSAPASAELTLWLKYYAEGVQAVDNAEYAKAETLLLAAKQESTITLPKENFRLASTLDALGQVYTAQGRYDEAQKALNTALAMKKDVLGSHQRELPKTVVALGDLYWASGQYEKVERQYRNALLILATDQTSLQVCRGLNGLALLYMQQDKTTEAEALLRRAIRTHEQADRRTHPHMATTLANLAKLCATQGRNDEAIALYTKAIAIQEKALSESHPDRLATRDAKNVLLARMCNKAGA